MPRPLDIAPVLSGVDSAPEGSTIIISSEEFCQGNHYPEAMGNLQGFLAPLDAAVTIVAYKRDPVEFLLSIYHHELRDADTTIRFDQWIKEFPLDALTSMDGCRSGTT